MSIFFSTCKQAPVCKKPPDSSRQNHPCVLQPAINPTNDLVHAAPRCSPRCSDPVSCIRYGQPLTRPPPLVFFFSLPAAVVTLPPQAARYHEAGEETRMGCTQTLLLLHTLSSCHLTFTSPILWQRGTFLPNGGIKRCVLVRVLPVTRCSPTGQNQRGPSSRCESENLKKRQEREKTVKKVCVAVWPPNSVCCRDTSSMVLKGSTLVCQRESVSNVLVTCNFSFSFFCPPQFQNTCDASCLGVCVFFFFSDRVCYSPRYSGYYLLV